MAAVLVFLAAAAGTGSVAREPLTGHFYLLIPGPAAEGILSDSAAPLVTQRARQPWRPVVRWLPSITRSARPGQTPRPPGLQAASAPARSPLAWRAGRDGTRYFGSLVSC